MRFYFFDREICIISLGFLILECLPIMHVLSNTYLFGIKIILLFWFLILVLRRNLMDFIRFSFILIMSFIINTMAWSYCYSTYMNYPAFISQAMLCWGYMIIGIYICKYASNNCRNKILNYLICIVSLTAVTTMLGIKDDPFAVRALGNGEVGLIHDSVFYYMRNIASWGIVYSYAFILPLLIYKYKARRELKYLLIFILVELMVICSQIMFAILISIAFIILSNIKIKSKGDFVKKFFVVILFFIPIVYYQNELLIFFINVALGTNNDMIGIRLQQIYTSINTGVAGGDVAGRSDLYMTSLCTFLENPILGYDASSDFSRTHVGYHSQIFDMLAVTGLLGVVPLLMMFAYLINYMYCLINNKIIENSFIISIIMICGLMFLNPTFYASGIYLVIFILPALMKIDERLV